MNVGKRIKDRRRELKYSVDYVAQKLGKNRATVYRYESDEIENMPTEVIKDLSIVLETSPAYLMGWTDTIDDLDSYHEYDYFDTHVSAGLPNEVEGITSDKVRIPDIIMGKYAGKNNLFLTRVNGDSMNNIIESGTLIVVEQIELSNLQNDDIVVFRKDNEHAVKRFYKDDEKLIFRPDSKDPTFTDTIVYLNDECDIMIKGKVVLYFSELD